MIVQLTQAGGEVTVTLKKFDDRPFFKIVGPNGHTLYYSIKDMKDIINAMEELYNEHYND